MRKILLFLVLAALAACSPQPPADSTDLPTVVVTELVEGEPATITEPAPEGTPAVEGDAEGDAALSGDDAVGTPNAEEMVPEAFTVDVAGEVTTALDAETALYAYTFELPGDELTEAVPVNIVPVGLHTLFWRDIDETLEFVLTFTDDLSPGEYEIGTTALAQQAAGASLDQQGGNAGDQGGSGVAGGGSPQGVNSQTGGGPGTGGQAGSAQQGAAPTAVATRQGGQVDATLDPDAAAETIPAPEAAATATEVTTTVVPSGVAGMDEAGIATEEAGGPPLDITPGNANEPSPIEQVTVIGARLELLGEDVSYNLLQGGMLTIDEVEQEESITYISGSFEFILTPADDEESSVTVTGAFTRVPLQQTPR